MSVHAHLRPSSLVVQVWGDEAAWPLGGRADARNVFCGVAWGGADHRHEHHSSRWTTPAESHLSEESRGRLENHKDDAAWREALTRPKNQQDERLQTYECAERTRLCADNAPDGRRSVACMWERELEMRDSMANRGLLLRGTLGERDSRASSCMHVAHAM